MQLYHTFISYPRADGEFALKLANDLRQAGVNVWLDQIDIPPGARWDRAVENALETSGRILVVLSPTSSDSENVQDEIGVAFDNKKPIIPVLYKPCEIPMRLRRLQFIDFTKHYDQGLQTLLTVMKLPITSPEGSAAPAPPAPTVSEREEKVSERPVSSSMEKKPKIPSGSRRTLYIAVGAAAVILILIFFLWNQRSDTGDISEEETPSELQATPEQGAVGEAQPEDEAQPEEQAQSPDE